MASAPVATAAKLKPSTKSLKVLPGTGKETSNGGTATVLCGSTE